MANLDVPLNEDGSIGTLPEQLKGFLEAQVKDALKRAEKKAPPPPPDPIERDHIKQLETELEKLQLKEAEREKDYEKAKDTIKKGHKAELEAIASKLAVRDARMKAMQGAVIKAEALKAGVDTTALDDFAKSLADRLGFNEALETVVLGEDGQPNDMAIAALVQQTIQTKPFWVSGGGPKSTNTGKGPTNNGNRSPAPDDLAKLQEHVRLNPHDGAAMDKLYVMTRKASATG